MNTTIDQPEIKIFPEKISYLAFIIKACIIGNVIFAVMFYSFLVANSYMKSGDFEIINFLFFPILVHLTLGHIVAFIIGFVPALITAHIINVRANIRHPFKEAFIVGTLVIAVIPLVMLLTFPFSAQPTQSLLSLSIPAIFSYRLINIAIESILIGGLPAILSLRLGQTPVLKADH